MAVTERLQRLINRLPGPDAGTFHDWNALWLLGYHEMPEEPREVRSARGLARVLREMPIRIAPEELIVGHYPLSEAPDPDLVQRAEGLADPRAERMQQALGSLRPEDAAAREASLHTAGVMKGHMTIDNETVLRRGLRSLRREAQRHLAATGPDDPRRDFYRGAIIALQAAERFALRYAELAERMAEDEADAARAEELRLIARICRRVPAGPAESFHEALQATWLMHMLVALDVGPGHHCFCPGRIDRYLLPALRADIESGRLTEQQARELLACLFVKYNEIPSFDTPQLYIVGGTRPDGSDACNELTLMALETTDQLQLIAPGACLAWHRDLNPAVMRQATLMLTRGGGYPAIFNDEVIVPGLRDVGVSARDAVQYVPCACTEITVAGRSNPWVASGYVNFAKALSMALRGGVDAATGRLLGARTPPAAELTTYDALEAAVAKQVRFLTKSNARTVGAFQAAAARHDAHPLLSCVVRDCLPRGRDINRGVSAARYVFTEPEAVGLTNLADGLAAIRQVVFQQRSATLEEIVEATDANFEGHERLRRKLLAAPKFGNDDEEVDEIAARFADLWHREAARQRSPLGGSYLPGYLSWIMHARLGAETEATPDGRPAREPLADCLGPAQGRDRNGPTAAMRSVNRIDLRPALGGVVFNLKFDRRIFGTPFHGRRIVSDADLARLEALLHGFFAGGGFEVQVNFTDAAELQRAQQRPEQFPNLLVRVAGYTARFTRLSPDLQDEIIRRTAHAV